MAAQLKDPDSAQFSDMRKDRATGAIYGRVNAKNSFGALAGYRTFEVHSDGKVIVFQ